MNDSKRKGRKLLASFFLTYFIVLIIPVTLGLVYHQETARIVSSDIEDQNRGLLTQASEVLDVRIQEMRSIGTQLISSTPVQNLRYMDDPYAAGNAGKVIDARGHMVKYLVSNDFIFDYVLFFNRGQFALNDRAIYSFEEFYNLYMRPEGMNYEQWLEETLHSSPTFGECHPVSVKYLNGDVSQQIDLVEFAFSFLPYHFSNGRAAVYVRQDSLLELLSHVDLGEGGSLLVENEQGEILASQLAENADIAEVHAAMEGMSEDYSSRRCVINGSKMLLMQATSPRTGVRIAVMLPEAAVFARMNSLRVVIVCTLIAAILLGGIMCYYLSRRNTRLLHAIARDDGDRLLKMSYGNALRSLKFSFADIQSANEAMLETLEKQKPYMLYTFVSRLINGDFRSENEALVMAKTVGDFDRTDHLRVLLFRFSGDASSCDALSLQLLTNYKAAIKLAVDSTMSQPMYIDKTEAEFALVLRGMEMEEEIKSLVDMIRSKLPDSVNDMLLAYAGNEVQQLTDVVRSYDNAESLIYIQPSPREVPLIFFDHVDANKQTLFYPQDIQHHLISCTMNGDEEGMINIIAALKERNFTDANLPIFMRQLLVDNLLNTLLQTTNYSALPPEETQSICDSIRELMGMSLSVQIQQVDQLFLRLCRAVRNQKSGKQQNLIEQVIGYIQTNYADNDLSLIQVADRFNVSESYLSYTFKMQSGINFVSFVENVRMTKAKELLRNTNLKIGDIAAQVGYASTNSFCRAFKRSTGESASAYRNGTE